MKPPVMIGVVLGLAVFGGALILPGLLRSPDAVKAASAAKSAASARQLLRNYDIPLSPASRRVNAEALSSADGAKLAESARGPLERLIQDSSARLRRLEERAESHGLSIGERVRLRADAAGLRAALEQFDRFRKQNEKQLQEAATAASDAAREGAAVVGAAEARGIVEYVKAADRLLEAMEIRSRMRQVQSALLGAGFAWRHARVESDYHRALDVTRMVAELRTSIDELAALQQEFDAEVAELRGKIESREAELGRISSELAQGTTLLMEVKDRGFTPGSDSAFVAYQQQFRTLASRVAELQSQDQLLRFGGRVGGADDGEPVIGLETLRQQLEAAEEAQARLVAGRSSVDEQIGVLEERGRGAAQQAQEYSGRLAELAAKQEQLAAELGELAKAAFSVEEAALSAAQQAITAFGAARQAASAWKRAAADLQSRYDKDRKNERLKQISGDQYIEHSPAAAEAAARVLVGRIHVQRIESFESLLAAMSRFGELRPEFKFDAEPYVTARDTAREAGANMLDKAIEIYNGTLVARMPAAVQWVPRGVLASAYVLRGRIDASQADVFRQSAIETLNAAIEGREKSPYLAELVAYRNHLRPPAPPAPPQPSLPVDAPPEPASVESFPDGGGRVSFSQRVFPILQTNCVPCHRDDGQAGFYGLRLTAEELSASAINQPSGQDPARMLIIPGDPQNSLLFLAVSSDTPPVGRRMPPARPLTNEEIELIQVWIEQGAELN